MATFRYRAATAQGSVKVGRMEGASDADVVRHLRLQGLAPIETVRTSGKTASLALRGGARQAMINAVGQLAIMLEAGLPLERALSVAVDNIAQPTVKAAFAKLQSRVKEGAPLSQALRESSGTFPPIASAMCEAGEANGRMGAALSRLAASLDRSEALRQAVISSLIYPAVLVFVATSVVLVMLLVVVPQFESLFSDAHGHLPFATRAVMGASQGVRRFGWAALALLVVLAVMLRSWLKSPRFRRSFDRFVLRIPALGGLVAEAETAVLARTLGSLVEGGVPLPTALAIAQRSVGNSHMAAAIADVAGGLKRGGGLYRPLAETGLFPPMAISFLRTGEETAQLGPMLERLADILDRSVRSTIQRLMGILTPAITVFMGAVVATVIASIMSGILGFNDLALGP